jgi:fatty acid desaturase
VSASAAIDGRSLTALALEWAVIALAIGSALILGTWWAAAAAFIVVATSQHALLILYHDAVHGHFARDARVNDLIVNLAVGVPTFMPVELYRPLHLEHHRALGTEEDPERQLLYARQAWKYRPLPALVLLRQLLGDLLIVNGVRTIAAWCRTRPLPPIRLQSVAIAGLWLVWLGSWLALAPESALFALVLWLGPLLTLTQLLQKLRSFAEHSGGPGVTPGWQGWTYSWRIGLPGRLTIWPYHIHYHREHHERPDLHWHQLPAAAAAAAGRHLEGRSLWKLLVRPGASPARD